MLNFIADTLVSQIIVQRVYLHWPHKQTRLVARFTMFMH